MAAGVLLRAHQTRPSAMICTFAVAWRSSAVPAFILSTAAASAAQDGPIMLTGLPLGTIDAGEQNGPILEAGLPTEAAAQSASGPQSSGISLDLDVVAKQ